MLSPGKLTQMLSFLAVPLLAAGVLAVASISRRETPSPASLPLDSWGIPELAAHLRNAGLPLTLVPTREDKDTAHNAFLTTTGREWKEVNLLLKHRSHIQLWRGTLYVERGRPGEDWSIHKELWGDCCLVAGPFIFFGDRALLARVGQALSGL